MGGMLALVGFLIVYGAVGGIENDGPLLVLSAVATAGLALMFIGVNIMNAKEWR